jgi:hypothetical protein
MQKKVRSKLFFANKGSKTARIRQTKTNPYKIGQIRQKSARNWESARNIFCPPDDFQIRQNFANLAEKTAIWQRCIAERIYCAYRPWHRAAACLACLGCTLTT